MPEQTLISMTQVTKVYQTGGVAVQALHPTSLEIGPGEMVSIVGPSGSGKSTLMNLLGCLDRPTSGTYRLGGRPVQELGSDELADVRNRTVGFVFQNFNLLPYATALENVELPLVFAGLGARERRRRASALLERVGLADRGAHRPSELSGGQMQRVAIARALANEPSIVLADEPTGNLDTHTGDGLFALMRELNKSRGTTFVIVTHNDKLSSQADRIVHMEDGRIR
jgi:putative ABC transport system ATP-binding protein